MKQFSFSPFSSPFKHFLMNYSSIIYEHGGFTSEHSPPETIRTESTKIAFWVLFSCVIKFGLSAKSKSSLSPFTTIPNKHSVSSHDRHSPGTTDTGQALPGYWSLCCLCLSHTFLVSFCSRVLYRFSLEILNFRPTPSTIPFLRETQPKWMCI